MRSAGLSLGHLWLSEHQHLQLLQVPEAWDLVTGGQEGQGPMEEQDEREQESN